jgi:HSP20 family protein
MQIRDLIPWGQRGSSASGLVKQEEESPVLSLQRDINRVFDQFWRRFEAAPFGGFGTSENVLGGGSPRTDIAETDKEIEVSVELPGMDEISMTEDTLTIKGEKKDEREEKKKGYYLHERSYGSFYRSIPLPSGIDTNKAGATFKKGVLTVTLPKTPEAQSRVKRVEVKSA